MFFNHKMILQDSMYSHFVLERNFIPPDNHMIFDISYISDKNNYIDRSRNGYDREKVKLDYWFTVICNCLREMVGCVR